MSGSIKKGLNVCLSLLWSHVFFHFVLHVYLVCVAALLVCSGCVGKLLSPAVCGSSSSTHSWINGSQPGGVTTGFLPRRASPEMGCCRKVQHNDLDSGNRSGNTHHPKTATVMPSPPAPFAAATSLLPGDSGWWSEKTPVQHSMAVFHTQHPFCGSQSRGPPPRPCPPKRHTLKKNLQNKMHVVEGGSIKGCFPGILVYLGHAKLARRAGPCSCQKSLGYPDISSLHITVYVCL